MANDFTKEDDENLAIYLSFNGNGKEERLGDNLYQKLVLNPERWPWSARHTWSSWLARYKAHRRSFDLRIRSFKKEHMSARSISPSPSSTQRRRTAFTPEEDKQLVSFLAQRSSSGQSTMYGRSGNAVYRDILVTNPGKYPWATAHPWQSWRDRYVKRSQDFDTAIAKWQKRYNIDPENLMSDVESIVKVIESVKQKPGTLLPSLEESTSKAGQLGTKRRKHEEADVISDKDQDDHPQPKKQKRSPSTLQALKTSPTSPIVKLSPIRIQDDPPLPKSHPTTSPVSNIGRSIQAEAEPMAIPGANSDRQGPNDVDQDVARDKESPRRNIDDISQHTSISHPEPDNASPVQPLRNEPSNDPSVRIGTNTPKPDRQLDGQPSGSSQKSVTSNVGHVSTATPMERKVPSTQAESTESFPTLSHAVEIAKTTSVPDVSSVRLSPARPGDDADARNESNEKNNDPKMLRQPTPPQSALDDPHHPTSPSARSRSDTSVHPLSVDSGSPTVIVKAEEKGPSVSAQRIQSSPKSPKLPLFTSGAPSDPFVETPSSARNTVGHRALLESHRQSSLGGGSQVQSNKNQDMKDNESVSDGPFASSPSLPRRPEVIRGLPRLRQGISFRDAILVRDRRVIAGNAKEKLTYTGIANEEIEKQETMPTKLQEHPTDAHKKTEVSDVFDASSPVALDSIDHPFVLSTANLPESSIASSVSSPLGPRNKAPHDKARRRTFADLRSSIPTIDLVEKLHKRTSSRSSALLRNRRASLDTIDLGSVNSTTPRSLASPEHRIVRYRPSRASDIPTRIDTEHEHTVPALLDRWSPSTRYHVIQAGLDSVFKQMEENHGFSNGVVRRTWLQQNMDLVATDRMLLWMRIAAEHACEVFPMGEGNHGFSSALNGSRNVLPSHAYAAPESDDDYTPPARSRAERLVAQGGRVPEKRRRRQKTELMDADYTPPVRSRAEQYRRLTQGRAREPGLANCDSTSSCSQEKAVVSPPAVWTPEEDEILRTGDEVQLRILAERFSEEAVRRRFVAIMREISS